jgi:hypothetical protein
LVKSAFGGKYRDVSVISCAACRVSIKMEGGDTASRHDEDGQTTNETQFKMGEF